MLRLATGTLVLSLLLAMGCSAGLPNTPASGALNTPLPPTAAPTSSSTSGSIRGNISDVKPADAAAREKGILGTIRVEGEKIQGNTIKKAVVTVTRATRIVEKKGEALAPASFEALQFGQTVNVGLTGPILESDPVQATASEITILATMPKS